MVTMLHQTVSGGVPTPTDLTAWADTYGLTHPVTSDPGQDIFNRWSFGQPRYTLLAPGGEIIVEGVSSVSNAQIEAVLPLP